ncbi:uncharacterized protein LOC135101332 [Scylla paramamosain]|uniref:uncharacterized protein LOC135089530 n=1 Tax=Scylla paramamosain TaxID=85552 RepID=UPI003082AFEA
MPKTEDLERRRRLRGTARGKLTRKCNLLSEQVKQGKPSSIIEDYYEEVKDAFRELERRHEDVMDALCESDQEEEDFNGKLKNEEQYIVQAELLKTGACETLLQLCKKEKETALTDSATKVKVKPIEPPKFEGDIRQYQTFRSNYDKIMTVNYGENAFALKQCLSGEALSVVHGVDDDYKEMFRRLDQRYADPVRLTDTVINQLQELKPIAEGNTGKFVETVEVIEKCWTDMSKNNLEVQMSTVIVISLIEKILPPQQKREWTKIYQNLSNKVNAFPELLKYLKEEKNVLDYIDKDVRKRSHNSKATVHSVEVKEDDSQIMRTLQKLQLQQAEHQANMESIMQKFTQTLSSGGSQVGRHRQNYGNPNFCWYHNSDSHTISRCNTFHNLEPSNKMEVLRKNHVCFHCLAMGHSSKDCQEKRSCYMKLGNGNVCGKPHHPRLHYLLYQNDINIHTNKSDGCTLLMIGQVNCKDDSLVTLFDPGSTSSLVTHRKARDLGLCGTPYNITMTTVGNVSDTVFTKMYKMPLVDETGKQYLIQCVGMDEITSEVNPVPMDIILSQLGVSQSMHIFRPHGRVDLLIGADSCDIIPTTVKTVGKLQLMKGPFGYCVRGSHPELKNEYTEHYVAQVNHMSLTSNTFEIQGEICRTFKEDIDNLFAMDHLGTNCRPKCTNCINCKDCNRETHITVKEEEEMKLILSGLEYQEKEKTWTVHYPWIKDPHHLPNNFGVALMKLKGTEKRLKKLGSRSTENYKVQIDDMLKRGVARKLNREELNWYKGPVHYLSHHEVLKQSSASTPTRIVFNASASYNGHVLNNYWAKGPNVMNSLFGLLLRFREGSIAFVGDIAKMFNSIRLSEFDSHVHRFLWRDFEDRAPDHYALTAVPFGDICSPAIAILAMRQTAEKCKEEFPEAANVIVQDSYMDDIIHSMNDTEKASQIIKDVELILNRGNFHMKEWIISGKTQVGNDVDLSGIPGEKVLGLVWNPVEDEISFKMKMKSTCKQTCSVEVKSNSDEPQNPLTKRKALSYISTIFDPMGFVTPEIKSIINTAEVNNWHINDCNMFDIDRFNSYRKIIGVTARVLNALHARSFKGILASPTVDQLKQAEILWIKRAQISLTDNWEKRFKRLGPFCKDGIIYVGSRIAAWLKNNYNNEAFILLPTKHRLTEVCIKDIHDKDHGGIESTLCKLQAKFWIPQARKLIKSVKSRCVTCRRLEKQVIGQSMGPVPEERLKPSPPFYHSALDLFGPLMIKDTVKGRCKKKVYGVVVNCLSTRASYVDLVEGYDTDSLITTLRRFTAIRGFPHSMYSDHGSQLKLASKEVCFLTQDQEKLSQFSREGGMEWKFTKSADAPWENGCSEAMVKLVKRVMTRVIGDSTLTFGELQSAMFEIANMLNERPIGMKNGSDCTKGSYLCPNDLILGRASVHTPEGVFDSSTNTRTRQRFINAIVKSFWKKWMMHYFSTLIVQQKWHCEKRNLRVGDIVLVQDSNNLKGHWKLAEVCQVLPSSDGKVRDVQIRYKLQSGNSMYKGHQDIKVNRSVHKLVLILPIEEQ